MTKERTLKARCRCGKVLIAKQTPRGFKAKCASCGASVRVRDPQGHASTIAVAKRRDSVEVTCICGHVFVASAKRVGHKVRCPSCDDKFEIPAPGDQFLDMYRAKDTQDTDEMPVSKG